MAASSSGAKSDNFLINVANIVLTRCIWAKTHQTALYKLTTLPKIFWLDFGGRYTAGKERKKGKRKEQREGEAREGYAQFLPQSDASDHS